MSALYNNFLENREENKFLKLMHKNAFVIETRFRGTVERCEGGGAQSAEIDQMKIYDIITTLSFILSVE